MSVINISESNQHQPILSVIMPAYNAEEYIAAAIESILNQSYRNFVFLILNDGSIDNTLEIINEYQLKDSRIKVISRKNKGLIGSLNELIDCVETPLVARMDADDIVAPNRFERQLAWLEGKSERTICGSWVQTTNKSKAIWHYRVDSNFSKILLLLGKTPVCHAAIMTSTSLLREFRYNLSADYVEDFELFSRMIFNRDISFLNVPEVLYYYNLHDHSICHSHAEKQLKEKAKILAALINSHICKEKASYISTSLVTEFLRVSNKSTITIDDLSVLTQYNEKIKFVLEILPDEYLVFRELLLNSCMKCEDEDYGKEVYLAHFKEHRQFCFIGERLWREQI